MENKIRFIKKKKKRSIWIQVWRINNDEYVEKKKKENRFPKGSGSLPEQAALTKSRFVYRFEPCVNRRRKGFYVDIKTNDARVDLGWFSISLRVCLWSTNLVPSRAEVLSSWGLGCQLQWESHCGRHEQRGRSNLRLLLKQWINYNEQDQGNYYHQTDQCRDNGDSTPVEDDIMAS